MIRLENCLIAWMVLLASVAIPLKTNAQQKGSVGASPTGASATNIPDITGPSLNGPGSRRENDPFFTAHEQKRLTAMNIERQKRMVEDAAKLLDKAKELKDAMDQAGKGDLSLTVGKKAEEIEKLARSVKDKMKG